MFTALTLAVTAVPMEAYALPTCGKTYNFAGNCGDYTTNHVHNHKVVKNTNGDSFVTVKDGIFSMTVDLTRAQIEGGRFDSGVRLGGGTTVTGGDFSGASVTVSGSTNINITGGEFKALEVERSAAASTIDGITIKGSLNVDIRYDMNVVFNNCTFNGTVTITGCNAPGNGKVTFKDCKANGSVVMIDRSVGAGSVMFENSEINASVKNHGTTTTMNGCILLNEPEGSCPITMNNTDIINKKPVASVPDDSISDASVPNDSVSDTSGSDQNHTAVHICEYEWVTVREAGPGVDGEECYRCRECGRVEAVQTIPATAYLTKELYDQIVVVGENGTVTYEFEDFHTISDRLLTTLQERKDVTLVITFTYQNRQYQTTFPAGSDYTELFEDEEMFYGLLGISGRCGIVTVEVPTEEAPAATPAA